jgi:hypothetical protein
MFFLIIFLLGMIIAMQPLDGQELSRNEFTFIIGQRLHHNYDFYSEYSSPVPFNWEGTDIAVNFYDCDGIAVVSQIIDDQLYFYLWKKPGYSWIPKSLEDVRGLSYHWGNGNISYSPRSYWISKEI